MSTTRKFTVTLSGVKNDKWHDGQMTVDYVQVFNRADGVYGDTIINGPITDYKFLTASPEIKSGSPFVINYTNDNDFRNDQYEGLYINVAEGGGEENSFFRREYSKYTKGEEEYEFKGEWKPVALGSLETIFRDFNIANDHTYQYIMYPSQVSNYQVYANADKETGLNYGKPVEVHWHEWSITELTPVSTNSDIPAIKKTYKADINNMWFFKYDLQVGTQTQNISKNEIQTLGQYSRFSQGAANAISGDVSCYLGSEIVPYSKFGYVERPWQAINKPLSTNEKITMLQLWRKFVYSKNPKLLKDTKGQSWIVQITSSSNTTQTSYLNQPDKINFAWREIESAENVIIYGQAVEVPKRDKPGSLWTKKIY